MIERFFFCIDRMCVLCVLRVFFFIFLSKLLLAENEFQINKIEFHSKKPLTGGVYVCIAAINAKKQEMSFHGAKHTMAQVLEKYCGGKL